MRDLRILAFDDFIVGTATTWYTSADHNDGMGMADTLVIHAVTTNISGTTHTVSCQVEHSADARHWLSVQSSPEVTGSMVNDKSFFGAVSYPNLVLLTFVRIRIWLGNNASAQCRLKLHVTGRVSRSASSGGVQPEMGAPGLPGAPGGLPTNPMLGTG